MSEYQYYEFRAIDRPLSQEEMDELRDLSTRAEITPTSFTNTYHWGDFKGRPDALMDRYFDAFVYVANWGTHRLMFRIPRKLFDAKAAEAYCDGEILSLRATKGHVVLELLSEDEGGDGWTEGEPWMPSLIALRADLMRGDRRALYLGWLASLFPYDPGDEDRLADEDDDPDRLEPPVPPGLAKLSAPLQALAEFLRVDDELLEVAAAGSVGEPPTEPSRSDLARWIKKLPSAEKDDYLLRFLAEDRDVVVRAELLKRFREATAPKGRRRAQADGRRTVAHLLAARAALVGEKRRKEAERAGRERDRRDREQAEARSRYLYNLSEREPAAWREVENLIATKRPKDYDIAVGLLADLRDLAGLSGRTAEAEARIKDLRRRHGNKPSLLKRLEDRKL
jgi:hypothetical protein